MVARLFQSFPGMEYCQLKRDRVTGLSKGYAYVGYSTADAAAAAVAQLNGLEFPPHSGRPLKVQRWAVPCHDERGVVIAWCFLPACQALLKVRPCPRLCLAI